MKRLAGVTQPVRASASTTRKLARGCRFNSRWKAGGGPASPWRREGWGVEELGTQGLGSIPGFALSQIMTLGESPANSA